MRMRPPWPRQQNCGLALVIEKGTRENLPHLAAVRQCWRRSANASRE